MVSRPSHSGQGNKKAHPQPRAGQSSHKVHRQDRSESSTRMWIPQTLLIDRCHESKPKAIESFLKC
jgi:hypothetical protein